MERIWQEDFTTSFFHNQYHIMTSSKQTTLFTTETSTSSQADSHVNHSALQENEKGKMMNATLWHEMLRAIQEIQPTYVVAENVRGLLTIDGGMVFEQVCADLEAEGYEVQSILLPAAGVNAPHRRDRIFIVAYSNKCDDRRTSRADETESREERLSERHQVWQSSKPSEVQQPAANANITSAADEIQARWNVSASTRDTDTCCQHQGQADRKATKREQQGRDTILQCRIWKAMWTI
jgi:site-specific DNA-cytosine methylase